MNSENRKKTVVVIMGSEDHDLPIIEWFRSYGYRTELIADSAGLPDLLAGGDVDLVLLDLDLSGPGSLSEIVRVRESFAGPLTVLSKNPDERLQILALELGADDFIGGHVSPELVFTRAKALLRRIHPDPSGLVSTIVLGGLTIDAGKREVILQGSSIPFTTLEFDLLWYLARNAGTVVSRNDIHLKIYNREYNGIDRSIDMYISRLRHKLGDRRTPPRFLKTVRGTGYLMSRQVA